MEDPVTGLIIKSVLFRLMSFSFLRQLMRLSSISTSIVSAPLHSHPKAIVERSEGELGPTDKLVERMRNIDEPRLLPSGLDYGG